MQTIKYKYYCNKVYNFFNNNNNKMCPQIKLISETGNSSQFYLCLPQQEIVFFIDTLISGMPLSHSF